MWSSRADTLEAHSVHSDEYDPIFLLRTAVWYENCPMPEGSYPDLRWHVAKLPLIVVVVLLSYCFIVA
jgi:hypothetical protein